MVDLKSILFADSRNIIPHNAIVESRSIAKLVFVMTCGFNIPMGLGNVLPPRDTDQDTFVLLSRSTRWAVSAQLVMPHSYMVQVSQ